MNSRKGISRGLKRACFVVLVLIAQILVCGTFLAAQSAQAVLDEVDRIRYPEQFFMKASITTEEEGQSPKVMAMERTFKKGQGALLELTAPARSKGTKFLDKDKNLWMFNPKSNSNRPIRLAPKDSFQGTAFSNSDVSRTTFSGDYTPVIEGEETIEHPELGKVTALRLRCDAAVDEADYGKILIWVRKSDSMPIKIDYYAKSGLLFRKSVMSDFKVLAGRLRASRIEMTSLDKTGTKSFIVIESMDLRENISDSLFNLNNLAR